MRSGLTENNASKLTSNVLLIPTCHDMVGLTEIAFPAAGVTHRRASCGGGSRLMNLSVPPPKHCRSLAVDIGSAEQEPVGGFVKPSRKLCPDHLVIHCILLSLDSGQLLLTHTPFKTHLGPALMLLSAF